MTYSSPTRKDQYPLCAGLSAPMWTCGRNMSSMMHALAGCLPPLKNQKKDDQTRRSQQEPENPRPSERDQHHKSHSLAKKENKGTTKTGKDVHWTYRTFRLAHQSVKMKNTGRTRPATLLASVSNLHAMRAAPIRPGQRESRLVSLNRYTIEVKIRGSRGQAKPTRVRVYDAPTTPCRDPRIFQHPNTNHEICEQKLIHASMMGK